MPWEDHPEWNDWLYRHKFTVAASNVAGTAQLTGVPLHFSPSEVDVIRRFARPDGNDIVFTDADGNQLPHELLPEKQFIARNGGWSWFSRPVAIYDEAVDKIYVGSISTAGLQQVHEIDCAAGTITSTTLNTSLDVGDDHGPPTFCLRSDGKILAYYKEESGGILWVKVSTNAHDTTAWNAAVEINPLGTHTYSYTSPFVLNGNYYLFFSHVESSDVVTWHICRLSDGTTVEEIWPITREEAGGWGNRPYGVGESNGTLFQMLFSTNQPVEAADNFKVVNLSFDGTTFYDSAGNDIGTGEFDVADVTTIFDGDETDEVWIGDITFNRNGDPHCLFVVYPNAAENNQDLYHGVVNPSTGEWTNTKVMDEGTGAAINLSGSYHGASCLDPLDDNIIWASKKETVYEIQKWTRASGTWVKEFDVTTGSAFNHFRPFVVKDCPIGKVARLVYFSPSSYDDYDTWVGGIQCFPAVGTNFRHAYFKGDPHGNTDTHFYCYFGNPTSTNQQDVAAVWSDYDFMFHSLEHYGGTPGVYRDSSGNLTAVSIPGVAVGTGPTNVGQTWAKTLAGSSIPLGSPNYAGATSVCLGCWFKSDLTGAATDEHTLLSHFVSGLAAQIGMRVEPVAGGSTLAAYVVKQTDTLVPANPSTTTTGLTVVADTYTMAYMQFTAAAGITARLNKTEATIGSTTGGAIDAGASGPMYAGAVYTGAVHTDKLVGEIADMWSLIGAVRTKDFTDTQYDNWVNGNSFYTIHGLESSAVPLDQGEMGLEFGF